MADAIRDKIKAQLKDQMQQDEPQDSEKEKKTGGRGPSLFSRASQIEVACMFRSFAILAEADYPLARALLMLSNTTSNKDLSATLKKVMGQVENGVPLSKGMSQFPWYFDPVVVSVVKAAEETARLPEALEFLAQNMEMEQEVRERAAQALAYPGIVGSIAVVVIIGILYFAAPQFMSYIQEADIEISGWTKFVFGISEIVRIPLVPPAVLIILGASIWGTMRWRRRDPLSFHRAMGNLPIFGHVLKQASLARFVNMFHMMCANSIAVPKALALTKDTMDNGYLRKVVHEMQANVEQGKTMAEALKKHSRNLPAEFIDMMSLAEETGRIQEILPSLSKTLTGELMRTATRVRLVAEPVLIFGLGLIVLATMLAFFVPYFDMVGSIAVQ